MARAVRGVQRKERRRCGFTRARLDTVRTWSKKQLENQVIVRASSHNAKFSNSLTVSTTLQVLPAYASHVLCTLSCSMMYPSFPVHHPQSIQSSKHRLAQYHRTEPVTLYTNGHQTLHTFPLKPARSCEVLQGKHVPIECLSHPAENGPILGLAQHPRARLNLRLAQACVNQGS